MNKPTSASKDKQKAGGGSARERLRQEQAQRARAEQRKENFVRIGVGLGVAIIVIALFGLVQWERSRVDTSAAYPAGAAGLGQGVSTGEADAPVTVELFEDFLCTHCRAFEAEAGPVLEKYVDSGEVRVEYHPVTLNSFGEPTVRAANAYSCAADEGQGSEFKRALFANFGQEWTNAGLIELGKQFGLGDSFRSCVEDDRFAEYGTSVDQEFTERGATGTPAVYVNGDELTVPSGEALRDAIESALQR